MSSKKAKHNYMLSSVKNALRVLDLFSVKKPERGIREIARELDLSHSTVQRILATLASEGYVVQDPDTKKYRLGVRLLAFNNVITEHLEIYKEALPILKRLVERTGETAHIGILEGTKLVYLHKVEPKRPIRVFTEIGKQVPSYCIAGGKVILAFQDEQKIEQVIQEGLIPYTDKTITDPDELRRHLSEIVQQGYATSQGEYLPEGEIVSIAAPIFDYTGKVFASLSLVGIASRISPQMMQDYIAQVKEAAQEISEELGYMLISPEKL